jgi:hypothetical protein
LGQQVGIDDDCGSAGGEKGGVRERQGDTGEGWGMPLSARPGADKRDARYPVQHISGPNLKPKGCVRTHSDNVVCLDC